MDPDPELWRKVWDPIGSESTTLLSSNTFPFSVPDRRIRPIEIRIRIPDPALYFRGFQDVNKKVFVFCLVITVLIIMGIFPSVLLENTLF